MDKIKKYLRHRIKTITESEEIEDELSGGYGDSKHPNNFDPWELGKGVQIEMEHTNDLGEAVEVAIDHLTEISDYYSRLEKMENRADKS